MEPCPKCGYERRQKDDEFVPKNECPRCGIIYDKFSAMQDPSGQIDSPKYNSHRSLSRPYIWTLVIFFLVTIFLYIAFNNTLRHNTSDNTITKDKAANPSSTNNENNKYNSDKSILDQLTNLKQHSIPGKSTEQNLKSNIDITIAINTLLNTFNRPLSTSDIFINQPNIYQWESIKRYDNYSKIHSILNSYRRQHTYMKNEMFICADMAMDIWNRLSTEKIESKIVAGNVQIDIVNGNTFRNYLANINHVWVLAQVYPSFWIPLETTGGYVVEPSMVDFRLYNSGVVFENPKQYKEFDANRNAMFDSVKEAAAMVDRFNEQYAGKPTTPEATEYMGRMKQKLEDSVRMVEKVAASLARR